jgi:hypothetical protein
VFSCGPSGCDRYAMRHEDDVGNVVRSVAIDGGEVWEIDWQDGTKDLWFYAERDLGHQIGHHAPG